MPVKITNDDFIEKSKKIHIGKYDYSKVIYESYSKKVKIICPEHGEFEQTPNNHLYGYGCQKCARAIVGLKKRTDVIDFITKANKVHNNKYDYSKVNYINNITKVTILCSTHGEFKQAPDSHLSGCGCRKCSSKERGEKQKLTLENFIISSKKHHGDRYDYSKVNLISRELPVNIICPKHGIFSQIAKLHSSRGNGCPSCNESKGEKNLRNILIELKFNFIPQHKFPKCKYKRILPFDFYLPEYNICIEFDGQQHFEPIKCFGGIERFNKQQITDKIKTEFCKNNNIKLLRIPYYANEVEIKREINFSIIQDIYK